MKIVPHLPRHRWNSGLLLLELILALTIFSIAAVTLARALNDGMETAVIVSQENSIRIGLRSFIEETRRKAISDMATQSTDDNLGVTYTSTVDTLTIKNLDGTVLTDLYVLHAKAEWGEGTDAHTEAVDLYLYEPSGQNINNGTTNSTTGSTTSGSSTSGSSGSPSGSN